MLLHWPSFYRGIGCAFGYTTFGQNLLHALLKTGVELSERASIAVHLTPPYYFDLVRFKKNVLFTMFEFDRIPSQWYHLLDKADQIIVPCFDNKAMFENATFTPVAVCPGGVDTHTFRYVKRDPALETFVFLYVGDDNVRKGTYHISKAWELWNTRYPERADKSQLIMKMTAFNKKQEMIQVSNNAYVDFRVLPLTENEESDLPTLPTLYQYASAFLFPTMGEGWGLPLCEALATGLPAIYTPFHGTNDTASEQYAYPVEYEMKSVNIVNPVGGALDEVYGADPVIESIVNRMDEIYTDYETALEKAKMATAVMQQYYTWNRSAETLKDILQRKVQ